jgi:hypothetical protein
MGLFRVRLGRGIPRDEENTAVVARLRARAGYALWDGVRDDGTGYGTDNEGLPSGPYMVKTERHCRPRCPCSVR